MHRPKGIFTSFHYGVEVMSAFIITDLLVEPVEVDEALLDATVESVVAEKNGRYYIDYLKFSHVFVCVADHRFEFTAEEFRTRHKTLHGRFVNKLEIMALQLASNSESNEVSA